jgi:hypothetical protein
MLMLRLLRYTLVALMSLVAILFLLVGATAGYLKIFANSEEKRFAQQVISKNLSGVFHFLGNGYVKFELIPELRELRERVEVLEGVAAFQLQPESSSDTDRREPRLWSVTEVGETSAVISAFLGPLGGAFKIQVAGEVVIAGHSRGVVQHRVSDLQEDQSYPVALLLQDRVVGETEFRTRARKPPFAVSLKPSFASTNEAVLQGRVLAHGRRTNYYFEYGKDATDLSERSPERPVGPARTAHYWDDFEMGLNRVEEQNGRSTLEFSRSGSRFYRVYLPSPFEWRPPDDHHDAVEAFPSFLTKSIAVNEQRGAGIIDLRDALIEFDIKSSDYDSGGTVLAFAMQTSLTESRQANWAFTGHPLNTAVTPEWSRVSFSLDNDANKWTYMGDNDVHTKLQSSYKYVPLDATLRLHDENIYVGAFFTTGMTSARGRLDIDNFHMTYRNNSILPEAKLVQFPVDALDPQLLTDGWASRTVGWSGKWPAEFTWELPESSSIDAVRIEQNFQWPSTEIAVSTSPDGVNFTAPVQTSLASTPPFLASGNRFNPRYHGHQIIMGSIEPAKFLRVRILAGPHEYAGLRQVSAYSADQRPSPGNEPTFVNENVPWAAGRPIFYRLVATNELGESRGEIKMYTMPVAGAPWIGSVEVGAEPTCGAVVRGRFSPLGEAGSYHVEIKDGDTVRSTPKRSTGSQSTPRDFSVRVCDVSDLSKHKFRLLVETSHGLASSEARITEVEARVEN